MVEVNSGPGKGRKLTSKLVVLLRARDGDNCMWCHEPIDFTLPRGLGKGLSIDHIRPRAAGGGNGLHNLQLMHFVPCQQAKGAWWNGVNYDNPHNPPGRHDTMSGVTGTGDRPS